MEGVTVPSLRDFVRPMRVPCAHPGCKGDSALVRDPLCTLHRKQRSCHEVQRRKAYHLCSVCREHTVYRRGVCRKHYMSRPMPLVIKPRALTPMGAYSARHVKHFDSHASATVSIDEEEEDGALECASAMVLCSGGCDDMSSLDEADCFAAPYAGPGFLALPGIHIS
jgi:hypothetical protein